MLNSHLKKRVITAAAPLMTSLLMHHLSRPLFAGLGHILTLHRVIPQDDRPRIHNHQSLEITPEHLEETIVFFKKRKYHFYSMDEVYDGLTFGQMEGRFVAFTFDDGYRDNLEYAYPILKKYGVPFTIYVTTCLPDHQLILWWYLLEDLVLRGDQVRFTWNGQQYRYSCQSINDKERSFDRIRSLINQSFSIDNHRDLLQTIFGNQRADLYAYAEQLGMSWSELRELARDELVTIGAHTVNHFPMSKLDEGELELEIVCSKEILETQLKQQIEHFAYPFGKSGEASRREFAAVKAAGFKTATTTRMGHIFQEHSTQLECLPRISLNRATRRSVLKLQSSGLLPFIYNGGKRIITF